MTTPFLLKQTCDRKVVVSMMVFALSLKGVVMMITTEMEQDFLVLARLLDETGDLITIWEERDSFCRIFNHPDVWEAVREGNEEGGLSLSQAMQSMFSNEAVLMITETEKLGTEALAATLKKIAAFLSGHSDQNFPLPSV